VLAITYVWLEVSWELLARQGFEKIFWYAKGEKAVLQTTVTLKDVLVPGPLCLTKGTSLRSTE
jgi:hypothetical protein